MKQYSQLLNKHIARMENENRLTPVPDGGTLLKHRMFRFIWTTKGMSLQLDKEILRI